MAVKEVVPGLYQVSLGNVTTFLLDSDGLTLIDTGMAGSGAKILQAVRELDKQPTDIRQILLTHGHPDHAGGLAEIKQATGAPASIHPIDAPDVRAGCALSTPAHSLLAPDSPLLAPLSAGYG